MKINARVFRQPDTFGVGFVLALVLLSGCGIFSDLPDFAGEQRDSGGYIGVDAGRDALAELDGTPPVGECQVKTDCAPPTHMSAACVEQQCVYECQPGYVDKDRNRLVNGCECKVSPEVCDGSDNDCDGLADNLFGEGHIGVGAAHSCATTLGGDVYCWGDNTYGQLGVGSRVGRHAPMRLPISDQLQASQIAAGGNHTCLLSESGPSLWCWGANESGQLGDKSTDDRLEPVEIALPQEGIPSQISAGEAHSCALDSAGGAYCWGRNDAGQLGLNSSHPGAQDAIVDAPIATADGFAFAALATGARHTCGISQDGEVLCWGDNAQGQLGVGNTDPASGPVAVVGLLDAPVIALSAGQFHTCVLHASSEVSCWGAGVSSPEKWDLLGSAIAVELSEIAAVDGGVCGIGSDGDIRCRSGESNAEIPGYKFRVMAAGPEHMCALNKSGRAYCWGNNTHGQIGNGSSGGRALTPLVASCG